MKAVKEQAGLTKEEMKVKARTLRQQTDTRLKAVSLQSNT